MDTQALYNAYQAARLEHLPGFDFRGHDTPELCRRLATHRTLFVNGATGSGKTTALPPLSFVLDLAHDSHAFVVVALPKRLAVERATDYLRQTSGLGDQVVSFAHGEESQLHASTRILFATSGWLLRKALDQEFMNRMSTFIVDEIHELDDDLNLLLAILQRYFGSVPQAATSPRLVLMSATGDLDKWRYYFAGTTATGAFAPLPDDAIHTVIAPVGAEMHQRLVQYVPVHDANYARAVAQQVSALLPTNDGTFLIFLPGIDAIRKTEAALQIEMESVDEDVAGFPLMSHQPADERADALAPGPPCRVLLATNVAESSVTIHDVSVVFDVGLHNQAYFDPETKNYSLDVCPISQSSAIQRAGRTGRTRDGLVLRFYTQEQFQAMPEFQIPSLVTGDGLSLVLKTAATLGSVQFCETLPDPVQGESLTAATARLMAVGAVDAAGTWAGDAHPIAPADLVFLMSKVDFRVASFIMGGIYYD